VAHIGGLVLGVLFSRANVLRSYVTRPASAAAESASGSWRASQDHTNRQQNTTFWRHQTRQTYASGGKLRHCFEQVASARVASVFNEDACWLSNQTEASAGDTSMLVRPCYVSGYIE
jgi:hypothetical protein